MLVACDAAYAGQALLPGASLAPFFDPDRTPVPFVWQHGYEVYSAWQDDTTGFKVAVFKNADSSQLIVAFAGTDGQSPTDWFANNFHLGINQWNDRNRDAVFAVVREAAGASTTVHFTGQSLGGALAQFAAHDLLESETFRGRVTLTTFNALGGVAGMVWRGDYQPARESYMAIDDKFLIIYDFV
jgi:hypothetical protein